jgi:hypothetical protein
MAGAPKGNQNAVKARIMSKHLQARIEERKLWPELMDALLTKALEGDVPAIKECFDRIDGKAPQDINLGGQEGSGVDMVWRVEVVERKPE